MLTTVFIVALSILALCLFGGVYRLIKGPTSPDRIMALDTIGVIMIAMVAMFSMLLDRAAELELILLLGILSFIGTIAMSKFIERGNIFERKRD